MLEVFVEVDAADDHEAEAKAAEKIRELLRTAAHDTVIVWPIEPQHK